MSRLWLIWLSQKREAKLNFEAGLRTLTWGFNKPPLRSAPAVGDFVIFGRSFSGGSPRTTDDAWLSGSAELMLGRVTAPLYLGSGFHWPDEASAERVIYPHRFGWVGITGFGRWPLGEGGPLPATLSSKVREVGTHLRADYFDLDVRPLLQAMNAPTWEDSASVDLSRTSGALLEPSAAAPRSSGTQGRSADARLNKTIERQAVDMAIEHLRRIGWAEIEELGKPFDLVCRNGSVERHVEVKGTTGSGASVLMTPNEVEHFRRCPVGADLIVVRDIRIVGTSPDYRAEGGELLHIPDYPAAHHDLQSTGWSAVVPGWPA